MKDLFFIDPQEPYKEGFRKLVAEYGIFDEKEYFHIYTEPIIDFKGY